MKELDEARRAIDQIILRCKAGGMMRGKARKQILNLKGNGWKIAIIHERQDNESLEGFCIVKVIWEAGDE